MENAKDVERHLVLAAGFSKHNASEAVRMFHAGELTETEKEVISQISARPMDDSIASNCYGTVNHLNYRISVNGGRATNQRNK